ncbi:hypothetical protein EEL50_12710 [Muribaculaceae bacterium Isolate-105 (HZI)]|nr:hypothetical protein EEL50_12710 [Muribaculaceae bacterium Isolate-105 (HZI)]
MVRFIKMAIKIESWHLLFTLFVTCLEMINVFKANLTKLLNYLTMSFARFEIILIKNRITVQISNDYSIFIKILSCSVNKVCKLLDIGITSSTPYKRKPLINSHWKKESITLRSPVKKV